ncbi:MAG: amidohydrolase family protein [Acidimicrobiales bacterium]
MSERQQQDLDSEHVTRLTLVDVEVDGLPGCTVDIEHGRVAAVKTGRGRTTGTTRAAKSDVLDGRGGALLPGLHDHHTHLFSLAARDRSVSCGPPTVYDRPSLARALAAAMSGPEPGVAPSTWLRGYGYDESVAGPLTADVLDDLLGRHRQRPVRIQHRSGHQWVVNRSGLVALRLVGPSSGAGSAGVGAGVGVDRDVSGVEIGDDGRPTGVLYGVDDLVRLRVPDDPPTLAGISGQLSRCGVTGVTDATASNGPAELAAFEAAVLSGELGQSVLVLGGDLPARARGAVTTGALKLVLDDRQLPGLDELVESIRSAGRRGVALHAVTPESLVLAATALSMSGGGPHRIEHASVAPPEVVELLRPLAVTVVTQPGFIGEHGDRYRRDVDPVDRAWLYRLRAWDLAGVPLAGSTDAPFGPPDPWRAVADAVSRRTALGAVIGADERLTPERALALFLGHPGDPGGPARRVSAGSPADLCLLALPWRRARTQLSSELVTATIKGGRVLYRATP